MEEFSRCDRGKIVVTAFHVSIIRIPAIANAQFAAKRGTKTIGKVKDISKREAEAQRKELEDSFTKGEQSPIRIKGISLKQFIEQYPDRRRQEGNNRGYLREAPRLSEATYAAWMGHSPTVSRQHYTSPTEAEYKAATRVA